MGHHWQTAGHGFAGGETEALEVGGHHGDPRRGVGVDQFGAGQQFPAQEHLIGDPEALHQTRHEAVVGDEDILSFRLTGNGKVLYVGDLDQVGQDELFLVSIEGGPSTKVNGPLQPTGDVTSATDRYGWLPFGPRVVYLADQDIEFSMELFVSEISVRVSGDAGRTSGRGAQAPVQRP